MSAPSQFGPPLPSPPHKRGGERTELAAPAICAKCRYNGRRRERQGVRMDFSLSAEQQQIRDSILKLCAQFDDAYWLEKDRSGEFPHELHAALAASRMARHRHAGRVRRRRPRHHRGGDHDAGDRRIRRRHERGIGRPHQHFRPSSRRRVRHRRAEAPHAAAADRRQGQGLLRRHRARRRARHHGAQGARRAPRRSLRAVRPEDLDFHRAGREQDSHPRPHHAARAGQAQDRGAEPVLHRSRSQPRRGARDREDGPPRGRFERDVLRRHGGSRRRPDRRRRGRASAPSCTA